jgi:hypothetical protein
MHSHNFFLSCLANNIDFPSKIKDCDDWQITCGFFLGFFQELDAMWDPQTLDCFASYYNYTKVERFFSRFWNPGCAGVDAFFFSN